MHAHSVNTRHRADDTEQVASCQVRRRLIVVSRPGSRSVRRSSPAPVAPAGDQRVQRLYYRHHPDGEGPEDRRCG